MTRLRLRLLGPPAISLDGETLRVARRKTAALLYRLALESEGLGRSQASSLLWPEYPPDKARGNLRRTLADASSLAPRPLVIAGASRIGLDPDLKLESDAADFLELAGRGLADPGAPGAERALAEAASLYGGEFLEGFYLDDAYEFEEWQLREAASFASRAVEVLEALGRLALERGDPDAAAERARRIAELAPASEAAKRLAAGIAALREKGARPEPRLRALPIPLGRLIGRRRELGELAAFLATRRLVTITGPGGVGKTRLALEAASAAAGGFRLGAAFVDLAAASDEEGVLAASYRALGFRGSAGERGAEALALALGSTERLLLLDNCEGVLEPVSRIASIVLARCPGVAALATSRVALGLAGEQAYPLSPLPLGRGRCDDGSPRDPGLVDPAPRRGEAEELFAERAAEARPSFALGQGNEAAVSEICSLLDGLPLAIELAAAMIASRSPASILAKLRKGSTRLASAKPAEGSRHASLAALFDWSWSLLGAEERRLFSYLSAFRGGFSPESAMAAAERLGMGREDASRALDRLVEASLVSAGEGVGGEYRYRLLETLRDYAVERLVEAGLEEAARDAHLETFAGFAREAGRDLSRLKDRSQLDRVEVELDNIRAALAWGLAAPAGRLGAAACVAGRLLVFWSLRGGFADVLPACRAIVDRRGELEGSEELGQVFLVLAEASIYRPREKLAFLASASEAFKAAGARTSLVSAKTAASFLLSSRFSAADAAIPLEEAERLLEPGDGAALRARCALARANLEAIDAIDAEAFVREAAACASIFDQEGDVLYARIARSLLRSGAAERRDEIGRARAIEADLESARSLGDLGGVCECVSDLAIAAADSGDLHKARSLALESYSLARERGLVRERRFGLLDLARIEFELGMLEQARGRLEEYVEDCRQEGSQEARTLGESYLAYIEASRGQGDLAVSRLRDLIARESAEGRPTEAGAVRLRLGRLEIYLGDERGAEELFEAVIAASGPDDPFRDSRIWTAASYKALVEAGRGKAWGGSAREIGAALRRRNLIDLELQLLIRARLLLARGRPERGVFLLAAVLASVGYSHLTLLPDKYLAERLLAEATAGRPELAALANEGSARALLEVAREELELMEKED